MSQTATITELYPNEQPLSKSAGAIALLLCAAPGLRYEEAAARLDVSESSVRKVARHLGIEGMRSRITRGGGFAQPRPVGQRMALYPSRPGQVLVLDSSCFGVFVENGIARKVNLTFCVDVLTRT